MIWNMRRKKKKSTWVFDEFPKIKTWRSRNYSASFQSNGEKFTYLKVTAATSSGITWSLYYSQVITSGVGVRAYNSKSNTWKNKAYRTVTFDEEPTGNLLTFLQANATPL